jgi:polysaccharide biosynthesis/export protein
MRLRRFIVLVVAAAALPGCMQTGGASMFARNAPSPFQQRPVAMRPAIQPQPVIVAQPLDVLEPQVLPPQVIGPQVILPQPVAAEPVMVAAPANSYTLDSGDKLRVVVFGQEGLTSSYSVDTSGNITMPLIGAVRARGMTAAGLQAAIVAKLRNGYVREPHVAVEVEIYRPFFILGEVTLPGQYPYVPNMTVETAVAIAGGYTPRAFKYKIEISRQVNGLTEKRVVSPEHPVRPGETVHIAERWF